MRYDDDELAEAALLLGHVDDRGRERTSPPLARAILAQARAVTAEIRFSTSRAAALAEPESGPLPRRVRPELGAWVAWLVAAACFAFAVYEWRHAAGSAALAVRDGDRHLAEVRWNGTTGEAEVEVVHLPDDGRHELWLSMSDAAHAIAAGAFSCQAPCAGRRFGFVLPAAMAEPSRAWITRGGPP